MNHPLIKYLKSYSSLNLALTDLQNKQVLYKKHGDKIIFKSKLDNSDDTLHTHSNGVILDINKSDHRVICSSFNKGTTLDFFKEKVLFKDVIAEENIEGTLINVYYYNKKWTISTRFCLDAENSTYTSKKSFRQYFDELVNINSLDLDRKFTYSFILQTVANRLVTPIFENKLYHLETTNNITGDRLYSDIGIPHPKIIHLNNYRKTFNSYEEITNSAKNLPWANKGYILYSKNRQYHCEILNPNYIYVLNKIKNQSNTKFICLRSLYYTKDYTEMTHYFPEYTSVFDEVINDFMMLVKNLQFLYIQTKCYKKNIKIPVVYEKIIRKIHRYYLDLKEFNNFYRINEHDVMTILIAQECKYLYTLVYNKKYS